MNALKRFAFVMAATFCCGSALSQMIPLSGDWFFFDADRLWNYNFYERSRWGAGVRLAGRPAWGDGSKLTLDAYAGYGVRDRQIKWGLSFSSALASSRHGAGVHASVLHDMVPAGSRALRSASFSDISSLSSFFNSRMAIATQLSAGYTWRVGKIRHQFDLHYHFGETLFDDANTLYIVEGDTCPAYADYGLRYVLHYDWGLVAELKSGYNHFPSGKPYLRLLLQFARSFDLAPFRLSLFCQSGVLPPFARGGYMQTFNLGGTSSSPFFFERSLLTVHTDEFAADRFVLVAASLGFKSPIFNLYNNMLALGIAPRPFVRVAAVIGDIDADYYSSVDVVSHLEAPSQGLAEVAAGIEGIVRWGVADWGIAVAYRLAPSGAPYHYESPSANFHLFVTASLNI